MASNNVVLITGANRGIGRQMAASLLLRPATTVIATVRDPAHELSKSLSDLPASEGSKIIVSVFDAKKGPDALLAALADAGIQHLNLVISNAGNSDAFRSVLETDPSALRDDFEVNAVGPFRLFQGCWPLLSKAETGSDKKFVLITSSVGSIAGMEEESFPGSRTAQARRRPTGSPRRLARSWRARGCKSASFTLGKWHFRTVCEHDTMKYN
uniref:Uncharacterized protein n=1 Tax=Bionectria ochroleuca TaxID=29856 RepID=A0A8H7KAU2_BIOOC